MCTPLPVMLEATCSRHSSSNLQAWQRGRQRMAGALTHASRFPAACPSLTALRCAGQGRAERHLIHQTSTGHELSNSCNSRP